MSSTASEQGGRIRDIIAALLRDNKDSAPCMRYDRELVDLIAPLARQHLIDVRNLYTHGGGSYESTYAAQRALCAPLDKMTDPVMGWSVTKGMSHPGYIHSDGLGEAELDEIWPDGSDRGPTVVRMANLLLDINSNYNYSNGFDDTHCTVRTACAAWNAYPEVGAVLGKLPTAEPPTPPPTPPPPLPKPDLERALATMKSDKPDFPDGVASYGLLMHRFDGDMCCETLLDMSDETEWLEVARISFSSNALIVTAADGTNVYGICVGDEFGYQTRWEVGGFSSSSVEFTAESAKDEVLFDGSSEFISEVRDALRVKNCLPKLNERPIDEDTMKVARRVLDEVDKLRGTLRLLATANGHQAKVTLNASRILVPVVGINICYNTEIPFSCEPYAKPIQEWHARTPHVHIQMTSLNLKARDVPSNLVQGIRRLRNKAYREEYEAKWKKQQAVLERKRLREEKKAAQPETVRKRATMRRGSSVTVDIRMGSGEIEPVVFSTDPANQKIGIAYAEHKSELKVGDTEVYKRTIRYRGVGIGDELNIATITDVTAKTVKLQFATRSEHVFTVQLHEFALEVTKLARSVTDGAVRRGAFVYDIRSAALLQLAKKPFRVLTKARERSRAEVVAHRADLRLPQSVDALVRLIQTDDDGLEKVLRIIEGSLKDVAPTDTPHVDDALMEELGKRVADVKGPPLDRLERIIERLSFPTAEKMTAMAEASGAAGQQ